MEDMKKGIPKPTMYDTETLATVLGMENIERIKRLRMMVFDVDGVLTDGSIIYLDNGQEAKVFDVKDGHGLKLLLRANVHVALISGRYSEVVERRAREIGIAYVYQNVKRKIEAYEDLLMNTGLDDSAVGYVGDDLIDIPVMKRVGWAVAVNGALPYVLPYAHYVTKNRGGRGGCREICDIVLQVKGLWQGVTSRYFD